MRLSIGVSIALLLLPVLGCSESVQPPPMYPVSGVVRYNGQPAAGVKVYLYPTSAPGVPQIPANPHGITDAQGRFAIGTFKEDDGAAEGGYQIILLWHPSVADSEEPSETDKLFGWYDAKNSKLTVQVKAGDNTIPTINIPALTGPPPESQGVPGRN